MRNDEILDMFGLTYDQTRLLFSAQKMITENDIWLTKNRQKKLDKALWLTEWEKSITDYLAAAKGEEKALLIHSSELPRAFKEEVEKTPNKTWYYIVTLELVEFIPYTALGTDDDKKYAKLKFDINKNYDFIKKFISGHGYLSEKTIDRIDKTYSKSIKKISGKTGKTIAKISIVVAIASITAAVAVIFAPSIAVFLLHQEFIGLHGIALANACLAMIGGGAIAIGGAGVMGGTIVIAGGGALLGLAGGGTALGIAAALALSTPEYTLTQAAKLETILKEVILNAQKDVVSAQKIIAQYEEQIIELNKQIAKMELQADKDKKEIQSVKTSLEYLKKSYDDMNKFTSSFEIGMQSE